MSVSQMMIYICMRPRPVSLLKKSTYQVHQLRGKLPPHGREGQARLDVALDDADQALQVPPDAVHVLVHGPEAAAEVGGVVVELEGDVGLEKGVGPQAAEEEERVRRGALACLFVKVL